MGPRRSAHSQPCVLKPNRAQRLADVRQSPVQFVGRPFVRAAATAFVKLWKQSQLLAAFTLLFPAAAVLLAATELFAATFQFSPFSQLLGPAHVLLAAVLQSADA